VWYCIVLNVRCIFLWCPAFSCVGVGNLWVLCFLSSIGYVQRGVVMTFYICWRCYRVCICTVMNRLSLWFFCCIVFHSRSTICNLCGAKHVFQYESELCCFSLKCEIASVWKSVTFSLWFMHYLFTARYGVIYTFTSSFLKGLPIIFSTAVVFAVCVLYAGYLWFVQLSNMKMAQ
jgi:hypothetical protein